MRFSLTSRDIIADSIEAAMGGHNVDAFVAIGGCDKNMPGSMIAIANMDIPAIFAYGGTIAPGNLNGKDIDLVSVFEGIGKWTLHQAGQPASVRRHHRRPRHRQVAVRPRVE